MVTAVEATAVVVMAAAVAMAAAAMAAAMAVILAVGTVVVMVEETAVEVTAAEVTAVQVTVETVEPQKNVGCCPTHRKRGGGRRPTRLTACASLNRKTKHGKCERKPKNRRNIEFIL